MSQGRYQDKFMLLSARFRFSSRIVRWGNYPAVKQELPVILHGRIQPWLAPSRLKIWYYPRIEWSVTFVVARGASFALKQCRIHNIRAGVKASTVMPAPAMFTSWGIFFFAEVGQTCNWAFGLSSHNHAITKEVASFVMLTIFDRDLISHVLLFFTLR